MMCSQETYAKILGTYQSISCYVGFAHGKGKWLKARPAAGRHCKGMKTLRIDFAEG